MKIKDLTDWMIMPQTIEPQGLIHLPGRGPNNRFDFKNKGNNRMNEQEPEIKYKDTINTDEEWKEAGHIDPKTKQPLYPQLAKLGPAGFAALVNRGPNKKVTRPENIKNTTAKSVQQAKREFPNLRPSARANFKSQIQQGEVERPIVVRFGPGDTNDVLIGGNTRFTGLMAMGIQPEVKFIDLSNQQEALEAKFDEYFSGPRTLGQPGYGTAHPLHPNNVKSLKDKFKSLLRKKKEEPKREWTAFERACMEGGHPVPEDAAGVGIITKQNTTKDVKPGDEYKNVKKLHLEWQQFKENTGIDWNALRTAGVVQPMLYDVPNNPVRPTAQQPNIITAVNLKQKLEPGEKLTPLNDKTVTPEFWQKYMDDWWTKNKNDPEAKNKIDQIKQSARMKGVQFNENFADGRVKGKSRPGRVKRAGASCKGSVSSLRSKAKKYSGERGKMYHWCANMKSGKKKS